MRNIPVSNLFEQSVHLVATYIHGVIEEFISRNGTDFGLIEASLETSFRQVKNKLENGLAVLVFDDQTETIYIFSWLMTLC